MPDFIVTQTAKEFADYTKKKECERTVGTLLLIGITLISCAVGYWVVWGMVVR